MGRLRATLAASKDDREMQECLTRAGRVLAEALDVCTRNLRSHGGQYTSPQARSTVTATRAIRTLMEGVGRVPHLLPVEEPPLPEHINAEKWTQAEAVAADYGHAEDLNYIQTIYEKLDPSFRRRLGGMQAHRVMLDWKRLKAKELKAKPRVFLAPGDDD